MKDVDLILAEPDNPEAYLHICMDSEDFLKYEDPDVYESNYLK